jgi:hypothetical protein
VRILLAAGGGLVAILLLIGAMALMSSELRPMSVAPLNTSSLAPLLALKPSTSSAESPEWNVVMANSAHRAMVVEAETERPELASAIADEIVKLARPRGYVEVLVYVRQKGQGPDGRVQRIQWTPAGGYVKTSF